MLYTDVNIMIELHKIALKKQSTVNTPKFLIFPTPIEYIVLLHTDKFLDEVQKIDGERIRYSWYLMPEIRVRILSFDPNTYQITIMVRGRFGAGWGIVQLESMIEQPTRLKGRVGIAPDIFLSVFIILVLLIPMTLEVISRSLSGGTFMILLILSIFVIMFISMRDIKNLILDLVEHLVNESRSSFDGEGIQHDSYTLSQD